MWFEHILPWNIWNMSCSGDLGPTSRANCCSLSLARAMVRNRLVLYEKVGSDLGLGGGLPRVSRLPPPVTIDNSRYSLNMTEKATKFKILWPALQSSPSTMKCTKSARNPPTCLYALIHSFAVHSPMLSSIKLFCRCGKL